MKIKLKKKKKTTKPILFACLLNVPCFHDGYKSMRWNIAYSRVSECFLYRQKKKVILPEKVSRKYKIQN